MTHILTILSIASLGFALVYIVFKLIQHYCHCRDLEWIRFCKNNGLNASKWPEYGYRNMRDDNSQQQFEQDQQQEWEHEHGNS